MSKKRIVLDTNCLISSLSRRGQYYTVWKGLQAGKYVLCVSTDILEEYAEIITQKMSVQVATNVIHLLLECTAEPTLLCTKVVNNGVVISNAEPDTRCVVYQTDSKQVVNAVINEGTRKITLQKGQAYILTIDGRTLKFAL